MRRLGAVGLALLVTVGVTTACEKVNTVASSVSPCFRVLPQARTALGGQGTFVDVARVSRSSMLRLPLLGRGPRRTTTTTTLAQAPSSTTIPVQHEVCLVAYKGTFDPTRISPLFGTARTGRYAIVIVAVKTQRVRAVVLVDKLPKPLHSH
jgi:hypothetical protein